MEENQQLIDALTRLCHAGTLPLGETGLEAQTLTSLGFIVEGDRVSAPADLEWLDAELIRSAMSERARNWLQSLMVLPVVGSTSNLLARQAATEPVAGFVATAELQVAGRGRRGRSWMSPLGQNLAVSAGLTLPLPASRMGGFSLAMGLAVVDCLRQLDVPELALKWPNDVLWRDRKLAGILIDLNVHGAACDVILGVGLNLRLPSATLADIDQPVADLHAAGLRESRNRLLGLLISSFVDYADGFAEHGFEAMRTAFDELHAFQGEQCVLMQGSSATTGVVVGTGVNGELLLDTGSGVSAHAAGEVSLRKLR